MDTKKLAIGAASLLLGGALIYYLSQSDDNAPKYDPKIHSAETIQKILDEITLETTCAHLRNYNLIQQKRESANVS
jgi:hypothetical protein